MVVMTNVFINMLFMIYPFLVVQGGSLCYDIVSSLIIGCSSTIWLAPTETDPYQAEAFSFIGPGTGPPSAADSTLPSMGFSMLQDPHLGKVKPQAMGLSSQSQGRLLNQFFCHVKRPPMYGHKTFSFDVREEL
jgi:hypothetical protein